MFELFENVFFGISVNLRSADIVLDRTSTILVLESSMGREMPVTFPSLPAATPYSAVVSEAKKLRRWRGTVVYRDSSFLFLLEESVLLISKSSLPFEQGDEVQLFGVHLIPVTSIDCWKVVCMCSTSSVCFDSAFLFSMLFWVIEL